MGRNRVSDDLDHVVDQPTATKQAKKAPPKQWPMPRYTPLKIKKGPQYGLGKLPSDVPCEPYSIFSLFFTEDILELLVENTNKYAANHSSHGQNDKPFARTWYDTTVPELRAFIATYIYMGVHNEPRIEQYWNTDGTKGPLHPLVREHISLKRWQQIDRFFHISEHPEEEDVFQKVDPLSEHLRERFKLYWTAGTHLTVDESIQRFMGRASETVNIPSKPVPEGFKIWILANSGYVLDWLYHAKGDKNGPVDLNEEYTKEWGFSKTQAVVFDLLQQQGIADDFTHVVWLDNLFTSVRLLSKLKEKGFGAAGTVRTTKTRREVLEAEAGEEAQKQQKESNRGLLPSLSDLKLKYGAQLEWGKLYGGVSSDGNVLQFGWKDQQVVLFMSTVSTGTKTVKRMRRRPAKTSTNAKTSRAVFGDMAVKELAIPDFIDLYNHFMNGVDVADQLRCYYNTQRVHKKIWKPLWHFLLDTTVCNSYKIANATPERPHAESHNHISHMAFRSELAAQLFNRSERLSGLKSSFRGCKPNLLADKVNHAPEHAHEGLIRLGNVPKDCEACISARRVGQHQAKKRKPLGELSINSKVAEKRRLRAPRSQYGCGLCKIHLCHHKRCWNEHINAI